MLAIVLCPQRERWLECALQDPDSAVSETASIVQSWTQPPVSRACPARQVVATSLTPDDGRSIRSERHRSRGDEWEYTVEVWGAGGTLVGSYYVTTCAEDDAHARSLALGQAILASSRGRADTFDPESAATFVVEKAHRRRGPTRA